VEHLSGRAGYEAGLGLDYIAESTFVTRWWRLHTTEQAVNRKSKQSKTLTEPSFAPSLPPS
jgi:hypothetical protein